MYGGIYNFVFVLWLNYIFPEMPLFTPSFFSLFRLDFGFCCSRKKRHNVKENTIF